jgi:2-polyprenyl-3-methyl-5-hydroxy-6-metoxy-1,4-benzoquinol methylase
MDYAAQRSYLRNSRARGGFCAAVVLLVGILAALAAPPSSAAAFIASLVLTTAIAGSIYYAPDYLHMSANPEKPKRWAIKARWRIAAVAVLLTLILSPHFASIAAALVAAAWICLSNVAAKLATPRTTAPFFLLLDSALLLGLLAFTHVEISIAAALAAAVVHFSAVTSERASSRWIVVLAVSVIVLIGATYVDAIVFAALYGIPAIFRPNIVLGAALASLALISTIASVHSANRRRDQNLAEAAAEFQAFTGYPPNHIRELWSTADKQLACNWESSGVANKSAEEIADWYRQNSELYMFAISAYNLEYKRIKSNLKMLRFAQVNCGASPPRRTRQSKRAQQAQSAVAEPLTRKPACLDYGAGNGELILELARRGHRAAYYDVDGVSKRFAQFRAARYALTVQFASTKEELRRIAHAAPFDTIFSFDVLEHIPDLAGELDFLISLLAPSGLLLFDVPAGATVNHPMHLDHTLNVREHLLAKGMLEIPMPSWRVGKQEKYAFRKASAVQPGISTQPQPH